MLEQHSPGPRLVPGSDALARAEEGLARLKPAEDVPPPGRVPAE